MGEVLPNVVTPLTWSVIRATLTVDNSGKMRPEQFWPGSEGSKAAEAAGESAGLPAAQHTLSRREGRVYLAADDDGDIVGYAGLMMVEDEAHVTTVAVTPSARKRGVGKRLMLALVEAALAAGARHLTLEVRVSNSPARDLYQRFGFAPVGLRKNYYRDEDALIMWAIDIDGPSYGGRLDGIREELAHG